MSEGYQRSVTAYLADATNATRLALRNLESLKSTPADIIQLSRLLTRCRGELRVAADTIDLARMRLLGTDSLSPPAEQSGPTDQCCHTVTGTAPSTQQEPGEEPTAGQSGSCSGAQGERVALTPGGLMSRVHHLLNSLPPYADIGVEAQISATYAWRKLQSYLRIP
jgi:hypothetical protein